MRFHSQTRPFRFGICVAMLLIGAMLVLRCGDESCGEERTAESRESLAALQRLNVLIGDWRGVGQPRRNSNKDAWTEKAGWVWDLKGAQPALVQTVAEGRLQTQARVEFDPATAEYVVTAISPEGAQIVYRGQWSENQLVIVAPGSETDPARRITITPRSDIRVVALHEATEAGKSVYFRVAEIGYTRQGKRLAGAGGGQPQCVVTGGLGTIEVQYKGETYYVCCTGCQQAFKDDPEQILAEYRARLAKERAEMQ
jgi:hypothetical protein